METRSCSSAAISTCPIRRRGYRFRTLTKFRSRLAKTLNSGERVQSDLTDFRPDDGLLAYVNWMEGELVARAVVPLYQSVEATVEAVKGDELQTSAGTVVVNKYTRGALPDLPVEEVSKGDRIGATCMRDASSGIYYAGNLLVLQ